MKTKDIIKMAVIFKIVFNMFNFIRDNDLVWVKLFGKKRARAMVNRILKEVEAEEE